MADDPAGWTPWDDLLAEFPTRRDAKIREIISKYRAPIEHYERWRNGLHDITATHIGYPDGTIEELPVEARPCPACGASLAPDETHWSIMPEPMGGFVCPMDPELLR